MKALILNSGIGKRMGDLTSNHPKCMIEIYGNETVLSRQLKMLEECGVNEVLITTGIFHDQLMDYCKSLNLPMSFVFVNNAICDKTNYIYSIYLAKELLDDDIVLMHGDLVFEISVLQDLLKYDKSCMTVSSTIPLPQKDFKAVVNHGLIRKIGVEFFDDAVAAQPLYKIYQKDWELWLKDIVAYCENGQVNCYAENAFNEVSDQCHIYPLDYTDRICCEIDTPQDLATVNCCLAKAL